MKLILLASLVLACASSPRRATIPPPATPEPRPVRASRVADALLRECMEHNPGFLTVPGGVGFIQYERDALIPGLFVCLFGNPRPTAVVPIVMVLTDLQNARERIRSASEAMSAFRWLAMGWGVVSTDSHEGLALHVDASELRRELRAAGVSGVWIFFNGRTLHCQFEPPRGRMPQSTIADL